MRVIYDKKERKRGSTDRKDLRDVHECARAVALHRLQHCLPRLEAARELLLLKPGNAVTQNCLKGCRVDGLVFKRVESVIKSSALLRVLPTWAHQKHGWTFLRIIAVGVAKSYLDNHGCCSTSDSRELFNHLHLKCPDFLFFTFDCCVSNRLNELQ